MVAVWSQKVLKAKAKGLAKAKAKSGKAKAKAKAKPKAKSEAKAVEIPPLPELRRESFDLVKFIAAVWKEAGYVAKKPASTLAGHLKVSSCCTGSGSFGYVLKKMLKVANAGWTADEILGSEKDASAQLFLIKNRRNPNCLFQD